MGDEQEALRARHPKRDEPLLVVGMIGIVERLGERIEEDGLRFLEGDIMLADILRSLPDVPLVDHASLYRRWPALLPGGAHDCRTMTHVARND